MILKVYKGIIYCEKFNPNDRLIPPRGKMSK